MAEPFSDGPSGWATILSAGTIVLTGLFTAWLYIRRKVHTALSAWRGGDEELEVDLEAKINQGDALLASRLTDLAANAVRENEAMMRAITQRQDKHEARDEERFSHLYGRFDEMKDSMARRDDIARVEGKIDQLILNVMRQSPTPRNRA